MLAVLLEEPKTNDEWNRWAFHHREHHDSIRDAIRQTVATVSLTSQGTGYTNGTYDLSFTGTGTGAAGTYTVAGGVVTSLTLSERGKGYTAAPTVSFPSGGGSSAAATAALNANLTEYPLDPISWNDIGQWLIWNQQTHNDMNGVLGLQSQDLQSFDIKNQRSVEEWIWNHYQEHLAAADTLEID